jgi:hypothetical protein
MARRQNPLTSSISRQSDELLPLRCLPRRSCAKAGAKRARRPQGDGYRSNSLEVVLLRLETARLRAGDPARRGPRGSKTNRARRQQGDGYRQTSGSATATLFCRRLRFGLRVVGGGCAIEPAPFEQGPDVRIASDEILKQAKSIGRPSP